MRDNDRDKDCIEEMIRDVWSPPLPDGMHNRVLMRTREQYAEIARVNLRRRRRLLWMAAVALTFVLIANLSESTRSVRLAALIKVPAARSSSVSVPSILAQQQEPERLLALADGSGFASSL